MKILNVSILEFAKEVAFANVTPEYTVQVIDQVQKLIDNGMWFSDACEVVAILTNFKKQAAGANDKRKISEFWDFISDNCWSQNGSKPLTPNPIW